MSTVPTLDLAAAITAVETAQTAYQGAANQTVLDQATVTAAQAKLDAANAQVTTDKDAQTTAASAFNASLDALIASATAAKIA